MVNIEKLKKAKQQQKMTFEQLSVKSGIPLSTIYDIFRGVTTSPRIDTLEAIEKALGINGEEQKEKPEAESNGQNEKERRLLEMFRQLLPNLQDYLLNTAETLIEASSGGQSKTIPAQSKRA
jgi:transcriptional regulator with XRE-family HTH domain